MLSKLAIISIVFSAACAAEVDGYYEAGPAAPDLSSTDVALLPDGLEAEHAQDLDVVLAAETPQNDAATFDDDTVETIVDAEVTDTDPSADAPAFHLALLKWGIHPRASDALRNAGVSSWRIMQTIGNAAASAGTHARDGYVNGQPYSAATDISVSGLSSSQIINLVERMGKLGFAAFYRHSGFDGWSGVNHIHAVYANCAMKSALRSQVRSWLAGRNGLVSNAIYHFHTFSAAARAAVTAKFSMSQEGTSNSGAGVSGRVNTGGTALHIRATTSLSGALVGSLANGTYFAISCQKHGGSVIGTYGTSTLWDRVGGGFVADAYVATGSDGQVAPTCP